MMIECVGTMTCEEGMCGKTCDVTEPEDGTCSNSFDCGVEEYCAGNGMCLANGACEDVKDCSNADNLFPIISCMGTIFCEEGMCGKTCGESQVFQCMSSFDDCGMDEYCAGNGLCLANGTCEQAEDCSNEDNSFISIDCIGTTFCEDGMCGKTCDSFCSTSDDCGMEEYCASDGTCLPFMACDQTEDCSNPDNTFLSDSCVGTTTCEKGTCAKTCDRFCSTNDDCREQEYCSSDGTCRTIGTCAQVKDCDNLVSVGCVGTTTCDEGVCSKKCDTFCSTSDDCGMEEYCASNGKCLPFIACAEMEDCFNPDNSFVTVGCDGKTFCEEGMCGKTCTCGGSDDCETEEYCSSNNTCLPIMACDRVEDCSNPDNSFVTIECVGTTTCENGMCDKTCDSAENGAMSSSNDATTAEGAASSLTHGVAVAIVLTATVIAVV